jgi:DNA-binding NarL/FixJ family response regulator
MFVLVVDDEALSRDGLSLFVTTVFPKAQVTKRSNATEAFKTAVAQQFNLIIIDIGLRSGKTGLELLIELREGESLNRTSPILIVSGRDDKPNVQAAFRYGANGFLSKGKDNFDTIEKAIRQTIGGDTFFPEELERDFRAEIPKVQAWDHISLVEEISSWTARQRETAHWKYLGAADKVIAEQMGISEGVVRKYADAIFLKLGVSKRAQFMVLLGDHTVKRSHLKKE